MAVTIKDVAKRADVCPSTVSRVLANNPKISDKTKEKVLAAVKELNYHPNVIARSLANKSTRTLGLILPNEAEDLFKNPFFIQVMTGISIYAQKRGYYMMYSFGSTQNDELSIVKSYIQSHLVEGIILLISRQNDIVIEYLKKKNFPFVVIGRPKNTKNILWVDNDNFQAMYNVVSTIQMKCQYDFSFIGGPIDMTVSRDRLLGYKMALKTHEIDIDEKMIILEPNFSEKCGYNAMLNILKIKIPSTVITTDDLLAFGAMKALKEKNIKGVRIVGFNNTPLAEYQNPSLSSVDINSNKLGHYAGKLLIDKLEKVNMPANHYIIGTNFIERNSTKD